MRAAVFRGPGDIEVGERPDPVIREPTDAIVRVVLGCVCGSDLWYYRGESPHAVGSIGHEFIGVVEETGADVSSVTPGDLVVAPFIYSDMSCPHCRHGSTISCVRGGNFGDGTIDGGQARLFGFRWRAAPWCAFRAVGTQTRRSGRCSRCRT
jgi:threonine dehydrogenase-like Zn-dependent dehydrogenase